MVKETILEFDLDVYGAFKDRDRLVNELTARIDALFKIHQRSTGDMRRTGCFHVELSLPEVPEQ